MGDYTEAIREITSAIDYQTEQMVKGTDRQTDMMREGKFLATLVNAIVACNSGNMDADEFHAIKAWIVAFREGGTDKTEAET